MLQTASVLPDIALNGQAGPNINRLADTLEGWIITYTGLNSTIADILTAVVIFIVFLLLSELARYIVKDVAPHLVSRTESTLDDEVLKAIKGPIRVLLVVAGIYFACKSLNGMTIGIAGILDRLASVALIIVGAYFISNLLAAIIQWYMNDVAPRTDSRLDDYIAPFLKNFTVATVYVIAIIMAINQFMPVTPLVAGLGIFGVAIAFAAREALTNFFGAFAILADRPYKVGDRIYVQGVGSGDVQDIGMRSTKVKTADNHIVIVPNDRLANGHLINLSQPDATKRLELKFGIGYASDADRACAILERIASETPSVSASPKPAAYVSELGDFAVKISLLVWIDSYKNDLDVADAIYRRALVDLKKEGIEIPYPVVNVKPK